MRITASAFLSAFVVFLLGNIFPVTVHLLMFSRAATLVRKKQGLWNKTWV